MRSVDLSTQSTAAPLRVRHRGMLASIPQGRTWRWTRGDRSAPLCGDCRISAAALCTRHSPLQRLGSVGGAGGRVVSLQSLDVEQCLGDVGQA
jgi:hypothetical protein